MKSKFIPLILILIFLITFVIFFKGLKNSNIYTPDTNLKKEVPSFKLKSFEDDSIVISEKIFKDNDYYFMNIWASWCIPCKEEHEFLMELKKNDKIDINYDEIGNGKFFYDLIYNPEKTNFLLEAQKRGNKIENGKMMFIYQAQNSFKMWTGILPQINEKVIKLLAND